MVVDGGVNAVASRAGLDPPAINAAHVTRSYPRVMAAGGAIAVTGRAGQ